MRLYVGNLPLSFSEESLKNLFSEFNPIDVKLIIEHDTRRSKGFGFVEIASDEQAQKAIQTLDKKVVEGKQLTVNEARPPQKREGGGGGGRDRDRRGGDRPYNKSPGRYGRTS